MSTHAIKGWCPGALRPMQSGDGLVVRVRPYGGRLDPRQAAGLADLAERYGNGLIDVTSRANLQIRGVSDQGHLAVLDGLARLNLLDHDPEAESHRNVLVTPFWHIGDDTRPLAAELEQALAGSRHGLPTKFGFAVDDGKERVLADASADIRIERDRTGGLLVRADGAEFGRRVTRGNAVSVAVALAEWFIASGGGSGGRGRMATHIRAGARLPEELLGNTEPGPAVAGVRPGLCPLGAMVGMAFGQLSHSALRLLADAQGLRTTPWRMLLAEGARTMPSGAGLIAEADDPALRVIACSGAPRCREAFAETRTLAAALAPYIAADARLHVSGCAKGCAHSGATAITLVATNAGFDLIRNGSPRAAPVMRGLSRGAIIENPSMLAGGC